MFNRILFATDFSERSLRMFDTLLEQRELGAKEIILMFVSDQDSSLTIEQRNTLDELHERLLGAGIPSREIIASGDPIVEILKAERRENVDLIAMASSGKRRAKELFVGSTSMGVLRSADRPVLLGKSMELRSILDKALVPLDLASCPAIIDHILPNLIELGLKQAILFHVVPSTHFEIEDSDRFTSVDELLNQHQEKLSDKGCELSVHAHYGTISYNILEAVREFNPSIIVMGIHRRSLLREIALGGNAEEVIRRSPISLLVVPCEK
ncbi:MAG: universal stress protein [Euryarchaeota archaeon]|nr:universal stress protein [Euryarchaeota archaeon]